MAKDIIKSSISYTVIGFLPFSFAFFFTPIYLTYLDKEQYGILSLFTLFTGIFAQLFSLGINRGFFYFYWDVYKDKIKLKDLIRRVLGLLIVFQLIFVGIGLIFGKSIISVIINSDDVFTYHLFVVTLLQSSVLIYYEFFCFYYRNEGKLLQYSIISIGTLVLLTAATLVGVVGLELEAVGAIYGRFIGYSLIIIGFVVYFIKKYGISLNFIASKALIIFSLPVFFNVFIGTLSYGADKIIIERFGSIDSLGIYGFALVFISLLEITFKSLGNAINPTIFKFLKEGMSENKAKVQGLIYLIILSMFILIAVMLSLLYPALEFLIKNSEFHEITSYVPILAVGFLWRIFTSIVENSMYLKKKTKLFFYNQTTSLLNTIILGYLGFYYFGIMGLVSALYLVRVIEFLIMLFMSTKTLPLPIPLGRIYGATIILSLVAFSCSLMDKKGLINTYLLYSIPLICVLAIFPFILKREILMVKYILRNRKKIL